MRTTLVCLALFASSASLALAQDTKTTVVTPIEGKPSADWTEADRSTGAIRRGEEIFVSAGKAAKAAPTIHELIKIVASPGCSDQSEQTLSVDYGPSGAVRLSIAPITITAANGHLYYASDNMRDKYVERKIEGGVGNSIAALLPGFAIPTVTLAARETGIEPAKVAAPFLARVKIAGSRSADGVDQVLVETGQGEAVIAFDAKTHLQKWTKARVIENTAAVPIDVTIETTVAPELATPIGFNTTDKSAVSTIQDLAPPLSKVRVGDVAPAARLSTLDGKTIDLASLKGKIVVLDLWATYCVPCKKGLPLLQKFAESVKGDPLVAVYAVDALEGSALVGKERVAKVKEYWTKSKYTMPTLIDLNDELISKFGVGSVPAMVIIGADGKIAVIHGGLDEDMTATLTREVNALRGKK